MALTYEGITMMAVAHEQPTWTKVAEQANNPILQLEVADAPPSGQRWDWSVTGGGLDPLNNTFTSQPTVQIVATYDSGMRAEIRIADIIDADWQANSSGNLRLHIERSDSPMMNFYDPTVKVSARCVTTIDFTVFQGQSEAGTMNISAAPGAASSTRYDWSAPEPHALTFAGIGGSPFPTVISVRDKVLSATTSAQPASPVRGDRYILPVGAAGGTWAGNDRKIATWNGATWSFETPVEGWICFSENEADYYYMNGPSGNWINGLDSAAGAIGFEFDAADATRCYGRITVTGWSGEWSDFTGNFSLMIKEVDASGTQTSSESRFCTSGGVMATPNIRLRQLVGDGYTAFDTQMACADGVFAYSGSKDLSFSPLCPTNADFQIDNMGRLKNLSVGDSGLWGTNLTFDLEITDGTNRVSSFFKSYPAVPAKDKPRTLTLRILSHTTFYCFNNQLDVEPTTINGNPSGASYAWSSSDASVVISNGGGTRVGERITGSGVAADTDVPFNLTITDGTRPGSVIPCTLKARHVKDPINIPYSTSSGSETVEVTGDSVTVWNFGAGVFSGIESVLSFNGGEGNTASISWGDNALNNDDSGTLTFTIQPNDASAPSCTVLVNVNISVTTNIVDITKPTVIECTFEIV